MMTQTIHQKAWALIPRNKGGRLHVVRVTIVDRWDCLGGAYVYEETAQYRGHFLPFARLASSLPRLRELVRQILGRSEKSASHSKAGDQSTQAAA